MTAATVTRNADTPKRNILWLTSPGFPVSPGSATTTISGFI